MGSDQAENRFFIGAYSDRQPVSYSILDIKAKSLALIEESAPWIDPKRMQPTNVMKIKTRDGHQFDAYLTLPAGASKANPPPLVVLPHGGPWTRDSWGFDGEVQFLASRGYAVLQPNYRGSTGYGWMYSSDDNWAFRKMHDDVTDAVKTLVKAGLVDPSRLAIMGTSFGGYLAMCGAAFEPDLYRCAITISGVFDWEQAIREKKYDQYDTGVYGILLRNLGNPKASRDEFDRISPLRHIDTVKIPVFVAHGKDDEVAAVEESRALIAQLGTNHVPFESLLVSGEGHGMSNVENQVELYTRVEAFLDKYLKPAQPVAAR
jgi:dipeptidyl aminopeptidase/acylaminoacyl peptidase